MTCYFNGCQQPARINESTCEFHKHRRACIVPDCHNQVFARQRCVRHGGRRQCTAPNCTANARMDGVCGRHGARIVKRICTMEGCTSVAHRDNKCIRHGGRRQCKIDGCETHARSRGYCWRHRPVPSIAIEDGPDADDVLSNDDSSVNGGDNVEMNNDKTQDVNGMTSLDVAISDYMQQALDREFNWMIDMQILDVLCDDGFWANIVVGDPMDLWLP
ncbi:hypothetical protein SPRG_13563 [Saprolegnia parasitica CBS 223.65]|uniref:WRKY transcription factor 19 n=1 Tax=Saprolegnia parasitica (strain CBS 223.65) TaxID=695850 RepID=A0A067BS02_SAPPC|nr:hypothetical protein SPRG_13563 [Saprolegnia parasitica CBS 223.65]KDO21264.1 hypothetical protein SPRG_13563 [Saprolegnia parasitica CBS 223.65]|eukprot:XP_012208008.1 hypothetical protein SPRG_13563 [Saprolegnia parasitica CBS 223.65]